MQRRRERRAAGFTMVEIIVVVIIIGVLATLIAPRFFGRVGKAKRAVARQKIQEISKAIDTFRYDYERMPKDLQELVQRPDDIPEEDWIAPSLRPKDLVDPWKNRFVYEYPASASDKTYDLYILGADGQEGGEGENADIHN